MANKKADFKLDDVEAIKRQTNVVNCWFDDKEGLFHCLMQDGTEWTSLTGSVQDKWTRILGKKAVPPKTGSNVNPAPTPVVKVEFDENNSTYKAHDDEGRNWESSNGIDWTEKATDTQQKLIDVLDGMKSLLLYKNRKYGDSAINPKKIFYKGDSTNSILIRLDDKIGRVMSNPDDKPRVNDVADIIGYCTLLLVSMGVTAEDLKKFMD